jgi:phage-related minor tail protein
MNEELESLSASLSFETERLRLELGELNRLGTNFGGTMSRAFSSAIIDGRKFSDVLRGLMLSLSRQALSAALKPLGNLFSGLFGQIFGSAEGHMIANGRVTPFAEGGIVNGPMLFPLRNGAGLMGEAGAEAIMPLARGPDGRLGVRSAGGNGVTVNINVTARDAESFRASQSQIAASMLRAIERGRRNL